MRSRKASRRWASALLSVLMTMALIPVGTTGEKVYAKPTEKTVAGLCTSAIRSPSAPNTEDDAWMGDYVWYGKYDGNPVRYRVLAPSTTKYGSSTMFLDCENTLFLAPLDTEDKTAEEPIPWAQCDLRAELNGSGFLTKSNGFTDRERDAIASSKIASHALVAGYGPGNVYEGVAEMVKTNTALTGEKIFILDVEEISNSDYGYLANVGHTECRLKYDEHGGPHQWWLRSVSNLDTPLVHFIIGSSSGDLSDNGVIAGVSTPSGGYPGGVSPAFNVKRSDILFTTAVKEYSSHPVTEYKLTLKDPKMEIRQYPGQSAYNAGGDWIAIPYLVSGENRTLANRMSVLILDKPYTAANTNDAQVLYYKKMDTISNNDFSSGSTASFRFPTELDRSKWGKSYYVYMVLEQENGVYETDYASEPLKIEAPGDPVINFQPEDTSEAVGNTAYFHIVATGDSLSYQWQSRKNSSAAWTNSGQKGAKTNQLEVETLAGLNGWQFRCIIKDANGKQLASKAAILTVLPKITYKSYWGWTYTGWTHELSIEATGKGPFTYQWQSRKDENSAWKNSGMSGAKTSTLKIAATYGLNGWQFRCIVTDANGNSSISRSLTLKVYFEITEEPEDVTSTVGSIAKFSVAADGKKPLTYQWQSRKNYASEWKNSGQPGAKTSTLSVNVLAGLNDWEFRCIVTDATGDTETSTTARLTVVPAITKQPKSTSVKAGSVATFTVAANGKGPLEYQWQSRRNASSSWSNSGQSGAKTATLNVNALAGLNGWQFRCVVTDANEMSWGSNPATLTVTK